MAAGSIIVDLLMRTGSFETDTKRAEARLKKFGDTAASTAKSLAGAAGVAGAVAAVAGAMVGFVKEVNAGVDALNDFADATGTTVENASALEDVAIRSGSSFDTAQSALVKFNSVLKDLKPGSDAAEIFRTLALDAQRLKSIDPAHALLETATALSKFADDGAKARAEQELFGKSVREVAPLLKDMAEKGKLVATVTKAQAEEAEKFGKNLSSLSKELTDTGRALAGPVVSGMNSLIELLKEGAKAADDFSTNFAKTSPTGSWGEPVNTGGATGDWGDSSKPSLLRNRQQMNVPGGGVFDWEANEERRRKATEAAEAAIRKAHEASRAAERLREQGRKDAWEIEKTNITAIYEAESKLRQEGAALYEATRTPLERLNAEQDRLAKLLDQGVIDWDTYSRAVFDASEAYDEAGKQAREAGKKMDSFAKNAAENIQRHLGDTLVNVMEGNFKDIGDSFVSMINRMVAEALAANIARSLFGGLVEGGKGAGMAGSAFSAIAGAMFEGMAGGGDVMANRSYLVGEKGPELFVPRTAGTIVPNGEGAGRVINININQAFAAGTDRRTATQAAAEASRAVSMGARNL